MKSVTLLFFLLITSYAISLEPTLLWEKAGQEYETTCLKFSVDGKYLFISTFKRDVGVECKSIQMWDVKEKSLVKEIPCKIIFDVMDISSDNTLVVGAARVNNLAVEVVNLADSNTTLITNVSTKSPAYGIFAVAFSADGSSIYVHEITYVKLQKFNAQTFIKEEDFDVGNIKWINFSDDGQFFSSVNSDTTVSVWHIETQTEIFKKKFNNTSAIETALSKDNKYLIVEHDSTQFKESIQLYSIETGELLYSRLSKYSYPYSTFSNDNKKVFTSTFPNGKLEIWDIETNQITNTDIDIYGPNMVYSPTDQYLAGRDFTHTTNIYNTNTLESVMTIDAANKEHFYYCSNVIFSPDNQKIYASGSINPQSYNSGMIKVYDVLSGNLENTYSISPGALMNMYLSKDGKKIAACGYNGDVYLIDIENPDNMILEKTYTLPKMSLSSVLISNDSKRIFACGRNSGIQYINTETDEIRQFDTNGIDIQTMAINSDGSKLIFGTKEKFVGVMEYNVNTDGYERIKTINSDGSSGNTAGISYVGFSADDKYIIVCASDTKTYVYDAENYNLINSYKAQSGRSSNTNVSAVLPANNKILFVSDAAPSLRIFNVDTGEQLWMKDDFKIKQFSSFESLRLSSDDNYLAYCAVDGSLGLYDVSALTSVKDNLISYNQLNINPNPATDYIIITGIDGKKVIIYTITGNKIYESLYKGNIDVSNFPIGIYFIFSEGKVSRFVKM